LLAVFARWERIAKDMLAAVDRGRGIAAAERRGEEPSGDWIDATGRVLQEAARIRACGAA